jgi:integrase
MKDYAQFAYLTGWRAGSISELRWDAVDLDEGEINLPGEFVKNGEPLKMPVEGELAELFARRKAARRVKTATSAGSSEFVFHRNGEQITQAMYQRPWIRACLKAGQGRMVCQKCGEESTHWYHCGKTTKYNGKLLHDFRRTAARDLIRSGTPQSVAMAVRGHKTNSMFTRYNITDTGDIRKALQSMRAYRNEREQKVVAIAK